MIKTDYLKEGDIINVGHSCELVRMMEKLKNKGIETDFEYVVNGRRGYFLRVLDVSKRVSQYGERV